MEVAKVLLLAVWLLLSLGPTLGKANCGRGNWNGQRAVKLAEALGFTTVSWMTNGAKKYNESCATGSTTSTTSTTTNPSATTPEPGTPAPEPATSDECTKSTVSVHYFHKTMKDGTEGTDKTYMVISDLSRALKCENGICGCAESGTQGVEVDGATLCIKKEAVEKYKECIHHAECKDKDLACVYEARKETNGDCGEIEDLRRFCAGAAQIFPTPLALPFLLFVMMVPIPIISEQT